MYSNCSRRDLGYRRDLIENSNVIARIQVLAFLLVSWLNPQAGSPHGGLLSVVPGPRAYLDRPGGKSEFVPSILDRSSLYSI